MKALIIDPALHSMGGHHYSAVHRLQSELARLGVGAPCLASAYADQGVAQELGGKPTFIRSVYGRTYTTGDEFHQDVETTTGQLSQALGRRGLLPDLIVLPCCDQVLASAVGRYLKRRAAGRPRVLLWILYGPHHLKSTDDPQSVGLQAEWREAVADLTAGVGDVRRIRAFCETSSLAEFYHGLLGLEVDVMPGPGLVAHAGEHAAVRKGPPTVSCIGFANRAKGYQLLPDAIRHVLARHSDVRFMIHGVVRGSDESDPETFDLLASMGERVVVRRDVLTPDQYLSWLAQADVLLLPYDREVYRSRGSGVFVDARNMGIPVIATEGCAFAQPALKGGWGMAIGELTGQGVGQAVLKALDGLDSLGEQARLAARREGDDLAGMLRMMINSGQGDGLSALGGIFRRWRTGSA